MYIITFELHDTEKNERVQHQISDRYSGLAAIHKNIASALKKLPGNTIPLPNFPPKTGSKHLVDPEQVKQRNHELSRYFTRLLAHPDLLNSSIVRSELKMRDNPAFHDKLLEFLQQRESELEARGEI